MEDLGYVIKREDAEKRRLGRKLDVMDGGKVYRDGFIRGVEYANQHGGKIHWGKVAKKVVKNPVARGVISGAVGDGVAYMTVYLNPILSRIEEGRRIRKENLNLCCWFKL